MILFSRVFPIQSSTSVYHFVWWHCVGSVSFRRNPPLNVAHIWGSTRAHSSMGSILGLVVVTSLVGHRRPGTFTAIWKKHKMVILSHSLWHAILSGAEIFWKRGGKRRNCSYWANASFVTMLSDLFNNYTLIAFHASNLVKKCFQIRSFQ